MKTAQFYNPNVNSLILRNFSHETMFLNTYSCKTKVKL